MKSVWNFLKESRTARWFSILALIICVGYYALEFHNRRHHMADFRVYYDAAKAFMYHTTLYGKAFGVSSGFYKYSPFATIPFVPLALLKYGMASRIFYGIITLCIIGWSLWLLKYTENQSKIQIEANKVRPWALLLITLFMADHIERELHLGNVNLFLLMASAVVFHYRNLKPWLSGAVYGIMLLFKPHFLILLPYFIWKKQWKIVAGSAGMIVLGLLVPALYRSWDTNIRLHKQWISAIKDHNVELFESPNTIYGILNKFVLFGNGGSWLVLLGLAVVAGLFLCFILSNAKQAKTTQSSENASFIEYFLLVALIPNLTHTDTEHFMWTWPLVGYVIWNLIGSRWKLKWIWIGAMILAFIPYTVNSPDIVGKKVRFLFDEGGLLGVANVIILITAVVVYQHQRRISEV